MATHDSFMAAILDHPEQDGPRAAYADWLDDRCAERAEFIRAQLLLATAAPRKPRHPSTLGVLARLAIPVYGAKLSTNRLSQYKEELASHQALMAQRAQAFLRQSELFKWGDVRGDLGLPSIAYTGWSGTVRNDLSFGIKLTENGHYRFLFDWQRGFVEKVSLTFDDFITYGSGLLRASPLQHIRINAKSIDGRYRNHWEESSRNALKIPDGTAVNLSLEIKSVPWSVVVEIWQAEPLRAINLYTNRLGYPDRTSLVERLPADLHRLVTTSAGIV
jgi:uncharacterized protein (TIGR02996 family)